jgi:hypothetical protein
MSAAAILVVVWLGLGSGTAYQVPFSSTALCEVARKVVLDDAAVHQHASQGANSTVMTSAVCLSQSGVIR